jgi:transposase-like protein
METMEWKKPRRRRSFTPEFKARSWSGAVLVTGRTVGQVARDIDLTETAVRAGRPSRDRRRGAAAADQRGAGLPGFSWVRR